VKLAGHGEPATGAAIRCCFFCGRDVGRYGYGGSGGSWVGEGFRALCRRQLSREEVTTGKVRVVPGVKWSFTNRFMFSLSPAARFIFIKREPYQMLDSVTGQAHTLPAGQDVVGFSLDNRYLLASQRGSDTFLIRSSEMSVDDEIDIIGGVLDYS
jgi:hypothetical protein